MWKKNGKLYCGFCGGGQDEVRKLIAGSLSFICDECVRLCMQILEDEEKAKKARENPS